MTYALNTCCDRPTTTLLCGRPATAEDTIAGCRAILDGECDDWRESSLFMVGTLEEARAKEQAAAGKQTA